MFDFSNLPTGLPLWMIFATVLITSIVGIVRMLPGIIREYKGLRNEIGDAETRRRDLEFKIEDRRQKEINAALARANDERDKSDRWYDELAKSREEAARIMSEMFQVRRESSQLHTELYRVREKCMIAEYNLQLWHEFINSDAASNATKGNWTIFYNAQQKIQDHTRRSEDSTENGDGSAANGAENDEKMVENGGKWWKMVN